MNVAGKSKPPKCVNYSNYAESLSKVALLRFREISSIYQAHHAYETTKITIIKFVETRQKILESSSGKLDE